MFGALSLAATQIAIRSHLQEYDFVSTHVGCSTRSNAVVHQVCYTRHSMTE